MKLANSAEILRLLRLAHRTPQSYRRLVLCAPFVSDEVLCKKVAPDRKVRLPTMVITLPDRARQLMTTCKGWRGPLLIASIPNLHAKIYLACANDERDSVALIGSFNLTTPALDNNYELGVCFTGSNPEQRRQIIELERNLLRLSRVEADGVNL